MIGIKPGNQHTEDTEVTGGFGEEPRDQIPRRTAKATDMGVSPKTSDTSVTPVTAVCWLPG